MIFSNTQNFDAEMWPTTFLSYATYPARIDPLVFEILTFKGVRPYTFWRQCNGLPEIRLLLLFSMGFFEWSSQRSEWVIGLQNPNRPHKIKEAFCRIMDRIFRWDELNSLVGTIMSWSWVENNSVIWVCVEMHFLQNCQICVMKYY
jgi:hypothetical protein